MKSIKVPLSKKSARVIVRPLEKMDYDNWAQAHSCLRPAQNEWDETNWAASQLTKQKFTEMLKKEKKQRLADQFYSYGIFRIDDGVLLGTVSLMDVSRGIFNNAYLGYRIFNIYWGQGYAQEACTAALSIAFKNLKLHRVEAGISPRNKKSIRTARGLNMRYEGLSKRRLFFNKKWEDMMIFALTQEEY